MISWKSMTGCVATDIEQAPTDLKGAVSQAGYARLFLSKSARVVVTAKVGAETVTLFDGTVTPAAGKAAPFEVRVRRHPDVAAAPAEPKAEMMEELP